MDASLKEKKGKHYICFDGELVRQLIPIAQKKYGVRCKSWRQKKKQAKRLLRDTLDDLYNETISMMLDVIEKDLV